MDPYERKAANEEILRLITEAVEKYPSMRFHQLLHSLDVIAVDHVYPKGRTVRDEFYVESTATLERVKRMVKILSEIK